jgi:hypothetical protein
MVSNHTETKHQRMKKKSSSKATLKRSATERSAASYLVRLEPKCPPGVELLDLEDQAVIRAVSEFFPHVEDYAPEWAKRAGQLALASAMPPNRKRKASSDYLAGFRCGEFSGALELLQAEWGKGVVEHGLKVVQLEKEIWASLSSDDAADFFAGVRDGEERLREMPERAKTFQRVKAFQAIAADWRKAQFFESSSQLHDWLLKKGAIVSATDSRETRKVCKMIGLLYQNKWRKPKA